MTNPDPEYGWNPSRSRKLGSSVLGPIEYIHPYLRAEGEFWTALPAQDAYVETTDDYRHLNDNTDGFKMLHRRLYSDVHEFRKPATIPEK